MATRRVANSLLATKSVHIRMQPRPANLSESREILRVLQRFGEISTYTHLRHEYHSPVPNVAVAIYRDPESAQKAIDASPIRFALEKVLPNDESETVTDEQFGEDAVYEDGPVKHAGSVQDGVEEILRPSTLMHRPSEHRHSYQAPMNPNANINTRQALAPFEQPEESQGSAENRQTVKKWFHITVDMSRTVHQDYVERQPFWKDFNPMKSAMQNDLSKVVPHIGLSDVSKRPDSHHRTPNHILRQKARELEDRTTLRQMWEEGQRSRG